MVVTKRQRREKPAKIEQRKARGTHSPTVHLSSLLQTVYDN